MHSVFLLWHNGPEPDSGNEMLIGVYRTRADCESAMVRLKDKPGFRDYPSGWEISEYELNHDHWTEGFRVEAG